MNKRAQALQRFVEEQLGEIPGIRFRRMFGGYGIYAEDHFFGIVHDDRLYFHASEKTQSRYMDAGMDCFVTPGRKKKLKRYFQVPPDVIEKRSELAAWARKSIETVA